MNLAAFVLNIYGPVKEGSTFQRSQSDKRVLANLPAMLEAVEEDLTSMLPEGYNSPDQGVE